MLFDNWVSLQRWHQTSFTPLCFSGVFENYKEKSYHSINAIEHSFDSQYIFLFIGLICLYACLCLCLSFCLDYNFGLLNFWTLGLQKNTKLLLNENKKHIIYSTFVSPTYLKTTKRDFIIRLMLLHIPLIPNIFAWLLV